MSTLSNVIYFWLKKRKYNVKYQFSTNDSSQLIRKYFLWNYISACIRTYSPRFITSDYIALDYIRSIFLGGFIYFSRIVDNFQKNVSFVFAAKCKFHSSLSLKFNSWFRCQICKFNKKQVEYLKSSIWIDEIDWDWGKCIATDKQ